MGLPGRAGGRTKKPVGITSGAGSATSAIPGPTNVKLTTVPVAGFVHRPAFEATGNVPGSKREAEGLRYLMRGDGRGAVRSLIGGACGRHYMPAE